jgi:hypothetical protein
MYIIPRNINRTPPIHSQRQAAISTAMTIETGIRCIDSARIVFQNPRPESKTSRAKRLRKRPKRMQVTLGVQNKRFFVVFPIMDNSFWSFIVIMYNVYK